MKKNILGLFLDKLLEFPLWVKQVIYLRLYQDLALSLSSDFININEEDIFHLYVPPLSFAGKTELAERKGRHEPSVYNFLTNIAEGLNMLEIAINNFWTMEEVAKYYILCLEQNYVKAPESVYVLAMAGFMSGKFRTGEYFKRVGKIDVDQLEQTIVKQKELAEKGTPRKMAEIMISLGFLTEKETLSLLKIKEESKKRFILDTAAVVSDGSQAEELNKLKEQNNQLKEQLRKILAYVKKNG